MATDVAMTGAAAPPSRYQAVAQLKRRFHLQNVAAMIVLFAILLLLPVAPVFKGWMAGQAVLVFVYIIAAQGVSILTGYTGLVSVGHGGFLAIGAYTAALLIKYWHVDVSIAIVAAAAMAGLIGMGLGLIFLRLAGPFMAIGTLGFAFFVGTVVNNVKLFEGRDGISLPANRMFGMEIGDIGMYYVGVGALAVVTICIYALVRSNVGRALKSLRDAEKAAQSCGVNRLAYRTLAFTISAGITGVAGALSGLSTRYVSAEVFADIWYSVDILVASIVGGPATLLGPLIGGTFVAMLPFMLERLADFAFILKGVVLIAILMFAPAGICDVLSRPIRSVRRRKIEAAMGKRIESPTAMAPIEARSS